jgi:glucose-6-phosphate isomerase
MISLKEHNKIAVPFSDCQTTQKLKNLAKNPPDFTKGFLTSDRLYKCISESCGYKLLYGTERINEDILGALKELAEETQALVKMDRLQKGDIVNYIEGYPSENRAALHTASRDFFDHPPHESKIAQEASKYSLQEAQKLKDFLHKLTKENKFNELITIGIGGSDLGPKAHYQALEHLLLPHRKLHFISNIDPDNLTSVLRSANLSKALVLINSKSGTTLETVTNDAILRQKFKEAGLNPQEHFISVSTPGSPLDNKQLYLECFYIKDWIGGRFSTSSLVGGVILSFAFGFDTYWELLRGANAMDKAALKPSIDENLPLLGALIGIWNRNFLNYSQLAIVAYSQALGRFTAHLQQLDMESNGKRIDQKGKTTDFNTGPIIFGEPGTAAQHSFFQLLHQGTTVVPVEFIGYKNNQLGEDFVLNGTSSQEKLLANLFAQAIALATGKSNANPNQTFPGNRPSHILLANQLTPYSLGALLAYYEHKIAFQGFIWGINSFDQEGVQLGKELANQLLDKMITKNTGKTLPSSQRNAGDAYLDILNEILDLI